jgi:hypothetical protein
MTKILNSYRKAIMDDTNSRVLLVRVLARKLCYRNELRVPPQILRTRRQTGGELLFPRHALPNRGSGEAPQPFLAAPGFAGALAPLHQKAIPRRSRGRRKPALGALCGSVLKTTARRLPASGCRPRVRRTWGARKKIPNPRAIGSGRNSRSVGRSNGRIHQSAPTRLVDKVFLFEIGKEAIRVVEEL